MTVIEVKQLFKIKYERSLRHQDDKLMLQRLQDPSYNSRFNMKINYDEMFACTWTGSVKTSISSIRNEFDETFFLKRSFEIGQSQEILSRPFQKLVIFLKLQVFKIRFLLAVLNFSFEDLPTSLLEKTD